MQHAKLRATLQQLCSSPLRRPARDAGRTAHFFHLLPSVPSLFPGRARCASPTVQAKHPAGRAHAVGAGGPTLAAQRPPVRPPPALSPPPPSLAGAERM